MKSRKIWSLGGGGGGARTGSAPPLGSATAVLIDASDKIHVLSLFKTLSLTGVVSASMLEKIMFEFDCS